MEIGKPQKVTVEPKPIRAPQFVPPPKRIPMEPWPEREKVPVGPTRRSPERQKEAEISFSVSLSECPYCSRDLGIEEGEWGNMLVCPRHGVLGAI